ncbi:MAG: hypothetical protein D6795_04345 [Deltaproteobacteria bacterium]|nr:MAG: hypothetical protein D6795_04345 [Deltaproteobacteria bacterium]
MPFGSNERFLKNSEFAAEASKTEVLPHGDRSLPSLYRETRRPKAASIPRDRMGRKELRFLGYFSSVDIAQYNKDPCKGQGACGRGQDRSMKTDRT